MVKTSTGLQYEEIREGSGKFPGPGDKVRVHYTGCFTDGKQFDSSLDEGEPFEFQAGRGEVIKGWDEGVMTMRSGGKRKLVIPPDLAYGSQGYKYGDTWIIPPDATLVFEIELLEILAE